MKANQDTNGGSNGGNNSLPKSKTNYWPLIIMIIVSAILIGITILNFN